MRTCVCIIIYTYIPGEGYWYHKKEWSFDHGDQCHFPCNSSERFCKSPWEALRLRSSLHSPSDRPAIWKPKEKRSDEIGSELSISFNFTAMNSKSLKDWATPTKWSSDRKLTRSWVGWGLMTRSSDGCNWTEAKKLAREKEMVRPK